MKLEFLVNYVGRETAMKDYKQGDTAEISTAQALELIKLNVAKEIGVEVNDATPKVFKKKVKNDPDA